MPHTIESGHTSHLERSCVRRPDSIRFGPSVPGIERAEVYLSGCAYEPHRHDTYAIGVTTAGVQTFRYRGARRVCLPGQLHFLHPDEVHDGGAGTDEGFGYRILYVAPEVVRDALPTGALPFVPDPVQEPGRGTDPLGPLLTDVLTDIDEPITELRCAEIAAAAADSLQSLTERPGTSRATSSAAIDMRAVRQVREYLATHLREQIPASTLEGITGIDRYTIARHFRRAFGTSPDRYRTLRRLELARVAIGSRRPLAEVAAESGFADQSHLTRQFKRAYGITPGRWASLTAATHHGAQPFKTVSAGPA